MALAAHYRAALRAAAAAGDADSAALRVLQAAAEATPRALCRAAVRCVHSGAMLDLRWVAVQEGTTQRESSARPEHAELSLLHHWRQASDACCATACPGGDADCSVHHPPGLVISSSFQGFHARCRQSAERQQLSFCPEERCGLADPLEAGIAETAGLQEALMQACVATVTQLLRVTDVLPAKGAIRAAASEPDDG